MGRAIRVERHTMCVAAKESHRLGGCSMVSLREAIFPRPYDRGFRGETPCRALAGLVFGKILSEEGFCRRLQG